MDGLHGLRCGKDIFFMLELKQAVFEDAQAITAIKVRAYNREINTYLHRDGVPEANQ